MKSDILARLKPIFYPRSVAIVGASNREGSFGHLFVAGLLNMGFRTIYPVNPHDREILGLPSYASVKDIPHPVDLAIISIPPEAVLQAVTECSEKGVKGVVIYTAGFGERGEEGKRQEQELVTIARPRGTRLIGPNCIGIYCPSSLLISFPLALLHGITSESGKVGALSQSGSLIDMLTFQGTMKGIRFSKAVSCGNECDLNALDFLEYLGEDPETEIIVAYLEGVKDGRKFLGLARHISRRKPIIIWKGGMTERGARAAASHTGALAGSSQVWDTLFHQAGIIPVDSMEELTDCLAAFHHLPLPQGRGVAIISGPGGPAVTTADACESLGLHVADFSDETRSRLSSLIAHVGTSTNNPVDLGPVVLFTPQLYGESLKVLSQDDNIHMLLVITPPERACSEVLLDAIASTDKPVVVAFVSSPELQPEEFNFLSQSGVAVFPDPKRAAVALSQLVRYREFREGP